MAEIPEEALKAAADAHERWHLDRGGDPDQVYYSSHEQWSRAVVEAVAPSLAEHIAQRIAEACPWPDAHKVDDLNPACDYADAARVARDTYPPTRTTDQPNTSAPTGDPT